MDKTVLVTGAAKRLGRAIALDLAAGGWNVAVHYFGSSADAERCAAEIRGLGVGAAIFACDFRQEAQTATLISRVTAEMGPLSALVNSASLFEKDDWKTATRESWDDHLETNLRAPFKLAQDFARQLEGGQGAIVNIIDQRVLKPTPQFLSYSLSKAGLHWLTTTLAQGMGPNIRVNAVAPGPTIRNSRQTESDFARQRDVSVLGRGSDPADICAAVRYLLGAEAVTGQMIAVDGGQHLNWQTPDVTVAE